jgi:hypothetical protein
MPEPAEILTEALDRPIAFALAQAADQSHGFGTSSSIVRVPEFGSIAPVVRVTEAKKRRFGNKITSKDALVP